MVGGWESQKMIGERSKLYITMMNPCEYKWKNITISNDMMYTIVVYIKIIMLEVGIMFDDSKFMVLNKSHSMVLKIYNVTMNFPKNEIFGLTSQIRRSATSVPSNIVEGKARGTDKEYIRFLYIARGSLEEVKYQILLAKDLNYISPEDYMEIESLTHTIGRMLNGLINKLSSQCKKK